MSSSWLQSSLVPVHMKDDDSVIGIAGTVCQINGESCADEQRRRDVKLILACGQFVNTKFAVFEMKPTDEFGFFRQRFHYNSELRYHCSIRGNNDSFHRMVSCRISSF